MHIPKTISLDRNGQYCLACLSTDVERVFQNNLTYYHCSACGKTQERSLVIDDNVTWWVDQDGLYWHESVGVIVTVGDTLLTLLRQIYPFAYAIPAGHLDKGEQPEAAARRELEEETGITVSSLEIMKRNFEIPGDSCRRGSDHHRWHLYRARLSAYPTMRLSDEASEVRWITLLELGGEPSLTYPLKFFVETFGAALFR
jgi:8-oxo-dGTP pyrophosphatase MutT (NUDIX family)